MLAFKLRLCQMIVEEGMEVGWEMVPLLQDQGSTKNDFIHRFHRFFLSNSKLSKNSLTKYANPLTEKSNYIDSSVIIGVIFMLNLNFKPLKSEMFPC